MPSVAVLNNQVITTEDIYKFNIDKQSCFLCFNCDKQLHFRQSRNINNNFTEHFYHPNTIKDTHIECEKVTLERIRDNDTWHNKLSSFIDKESREVIRKNNTIKHIVDAYDSFNNMGIEFQNSHISVEAIESRDATTYLDWIFNVQGQFICKVQIGNRIVCEIPHDNWEKAVKAVKNSVYLYTGYKEWILLEDRESYHIEINNKKCNVWIGKPCSFQKVYEDTCLQNMITAEGKEYFQGLTKELEKVRIIYARCKKSMFLLDGIHRRYVNRHVFKPNDIISIKSVAGSGKTTTLLELAKIHSTKKILYLAFNTALIADITIKIKKQSIENLFPRTFHSLIYGAYVSVNNRNPSITELRPQNIANIIQWFQGKPFNIRKYYVDLFTKFCRSPNFSRPQEFEKDKPLLNSLWEKTLRDELITFDSMLKLALINRWLKGYIDSTYDMIMIDETQDFDIMMLTMLLNDTTIPKIFVGDPKQAIYEWRGCINGFEHLPKSSLAIEFYSTFRVGDPACEQIRNKFDDCWMISKSINNTILTNDLATIKDKKYTYLFRTWKNLLGKAQEMQNIWIYNYDSQVKKMRNLHTILNKFNGTIDNEEFPDDLPKFLKSISKDQLESILSNIEENITTESQAINKFYTIHSYKGLEADYIRIADDIDPYEDMNLYYVALTRGMKIIVEETGLVTRNLSIEDTFQVNFDYTPEKKIVAPAPTPLSAPEKRNDNFVNKANREIVRCSICKVFNRCSHCKQRVITRINELRTEFLSVRGKNTNTSNM